MGAVGKGSGALTNPPVPCVLCPVRTREIGVPHIATMSHRLFVDLTTWSNGPGNGSRGQSSRQSLHGRAVYHVTGARDDEEQGVTKRLGAYGSTLGDIGVTKGRTISTY